jgi:YHS domain-containing protein
MENSVRTHIEHSHGSEPPPDAIVGAPPADIAECPVMVGTTVLKSEAAAEGLDRGHDGRQYWLCCDTCADLFDADPERYAGTA